MRLDFKSMPKTPRRRPPTRRQQQDIVPLFIYDFPLPLKKKLIIAAKKQQTNMNDMAVAALAESFGVEFLPSGRRPPIQAGLDSTDFEMKMPRALRRKIKNAAADQEVNYRDIVLPILRKAYK